MLLKEATEEGLLLLPLFPPPDLIPFVKVDAPPLGREFGRADVRGGEIDCLARAEEPEGREVEIVFGGFREEGIVL